MAATYRRAVGVFSSRIQTASALQALSDSGFSMGDVSVIAKDGDHQKDIAGVTVRDEVTNQADKGGAVGALTGGILGGVTGLLVGLGTLTIPGLGPALLAGEAAVALATVVGGAAGAAAGGIVGALVGLGIPEHRAVRYQDRVAQGDYLVMVKGDENEIVRAERALGAAGIEDWGVYQADDEASQDNLAAAARASSVHEAQRDSRVTDGRDRTPDLPRSSSPAVAGAASADDIYNDTYNRGNAGTPPDSRRDLRQTDEPYRATELPSSANPGQLPTVESNGGIPTNDAYDRNDFVDSRREFRQVDEPYQAADRPRNPVHGPGQANGDFRADDAYGRNAADSRRDLGQTDDQYRATGFSHSSDPVLAGSGQTGTAAFGTASSPERRVVGVFLNQRQMDEALAQLKQTGFPVHSLSIAVREVDASEPHRDRGGHSLAGATQLVAGLDRVLLPDVGTVMVMGPDAQALSDTFLEDRSSRTTDGLGIAPESARLYRRHLTNGGYLVTLRGNNQDVLEAASTLGKWGMHDWGIYDVSAR